MVRGVIAASSCAGSIVNESRLDVDEHRRRAGVADRRDRRDEGERDGDDLVARADAGREQRQVQRAGAGVDGDRVLGAAVGGELALEAGDLLAKDELRRCRGRSRTAASISGLMLWYCAFRSRNGIMRRTSPVRVR